MNDLKISHKDSAMVDKSSTSPKSEHGKVGKMTVRRVKKHDYLKMTLDFAKDGACIVDIKDYLKRILKYLPEDMNGTATFLAADHLLKERDNAPKLNQDRMRCQPYLQTAVSFLAKRVQAPDEDDYKKLA